MGLDGKNAVCPSAELLHNSWSRLMRCKLKKKKRNKYQYADGAAVKTSQKQAGVYWLTDSTKKKKEKGIDTD